MQPASYKIDMAGDGDMVVATLTGFFSLADVAVYADAAARSIQACCDRHGKYRMLLDVSGCAIQSQEVIAAFMEHVRDMPVSSRSAVVVGSSIVRMQVRRVMDRPNVALFESREEAWDWIEEVTAKRVA